MKRKLAGLLSDGFFHCGKVLFFNARRRDPDDEGNIEMIPQVLRNREACRGNDQTDICLIGEPVIMTSLAAAVEKKTGAQTHVFGATENSAPFLGPADAALTGEEELERALGRIVEESRVPVGTQAQPGTETQAETGAQRDVEVGASTTGAEPVSVVADPCYADILPDGCDLIRLPHLAFSGRIFLKEIPDLLQWPM